METLVTPVITITAIGGIVVLLVDFARKFLGWEDKKLKLLSIGLSLIAAALIVVAQSNAQVQVWLLYGLGIVAAAQTIYGLIWKDTDMHKELIS